ncbi:DUF3769 domain-containing protein [Leptolyngbya sp. FACHB-17]|uniref:DUF3769 domain-containing protein n=1 Tax=unclassified Leptolyngbya TaxID=2650499 RepID=UPI001681B80B|nr:DUF3769 domain-containing protein [Leptolyngbya sp. FACHB-17]MBD2080670.1 DUF3769 domain-containing protein [Leptolyngbya sp. FACHB-17]
MPYSVPPVPPAIVQSAPVAKSNLAVKPAPPKTLAIEPQIASHRADDLAGTEPIFASEPEWSFAVPPEADTPASVTQISPTPSAPLPTSTPVPAPTPTPAPSNPPTNPPTNPPLNIPTGRLTSEGILELKADRQEYDQLRQVFTAEGRVSLRFRGALLTGDRLQVNLVNRLTVAEGNVTLTRGDQILRGQRFRYNLIQEEGTVEQASGEIFIPTAGTDLNPNLPTNITAGVVPVGSVGDRALATQDNVSQAGGIRLVVGSQQNASGSPAAAQAGGSVRRLRFEAAQIEFYPEGFQANNIRITNDPFSPPELELRADRAVLRRVSPLRDEIRTTRNRLVFDQGFTLPLPSRTIVLDRNQRAPLLFDFGYDAQDRGGFFVQRELNVLPQSPINFTITPQFFVQRALEDRSNIANLFGLRSRLSAQVTPRTIVRGEGVFTSLDLSRFENTFRGSLRAQQLIGTHTLSLEASYRNRLFNNSLGFQDVQSSIGALFFSPAIPLGNTGINLSYQVGYQYVNADTDRPDLLAPIRANNRISLGRFQASAAINRGFNLWQGTALPATREQGLRFSPTPIRPFVGVGVGITGVTTSYSNGDSQNSVSGAVSLIGQFGHFSRDFLDYTAFNITYSQAIRAGLSPFLFDRIADDRILYAGITQQLYGPIRIGFQTAYNIQTGREISTDYFLEYKRRTYGVSLRYNPVQQLGSIGFEISDFNWTRGSVEPFAGSGVIPVDGGVIRSPQ